MDDDLEDDYYGEGWIYLPPDQRAELQRKVSAMWRELLDRAHTATPVQP